MTDPTPDPAPIVERKSANPPGVLPRHAQAWFIGGISVLMMVIIAFSGGREAKKRDGPSASQPSSIDPNQARIQEYRQRIEEQTRRLAAEQVQVAQARLALAGPNTAPPAAPFGTNGSQARLAYEGYSPPSPEKSWIELDKEKRSYQSLFASNVALSYRQDNKGADFQNVRGQQSSNLPAEGVDSNRRTETATPGSRPAARESSPNRAEGKEYRLFEGTVLETVLTNRLDGSFSGPVNCMITTNVYSLDKQRLLIPQGSRVLGDVRRVETFGEQRLAVAFHRLIMPDGYSVNLDQFKGLNQIGETGLSDQVDHHYLQVFGVSLAIGAIAGLSQANTRYGADAPASDAHRQGVTASLSQSSLRILDRYLNVLPTFTIREGHRVKVYLSGDLVLPAYDRHLMPSDL